MRPTLREWIHRLAGTFGRDRRDRDLEAELQAHLELAEDEFRSQGMSPEDAARKARIRFGKSTQTMEILRDRRGIPSLGTFWLDTKLGLRMLYKHWALTVIGGFAIMAAITLGASVYNFARVLSTTQLPLDEGDQVVVLQPWDPVRRAPQSCSLANFQRWRREL